MERLYLFVLRGPDPISQLKTLMLLARMNNAALQHVQKKT
jgi:hypothetical protein